MKEIEKLNFVQEFKPWSKYNSSEK